jgi:hypothetical protein
MKNITAAVCLLVAAAAPTAFGQLTLTGPDSTNVPCGTAVTLTTSVEETNGLAVIVTWWLNGIAVETNAVPASAPPVVTDVSLVGVLPPGTNLVDVVAESSAGLMVTNSAVVIETDTNPPVIVSAAPSKTTLWPPNHKLVKINVTAETTDDCGEVTWKIVKVRSNEPRNGEGDGNTCRDWKILNDHNVALRAERSGKGSDRIYTIYLQAQDSVGNLSATNTVTVTVPHDKGKGMGYGQDNNPGKGKGKK